MTGDPAWKRKIFVGGLALLLLPPVGWPLALGYRKEVAFRLIGGQRPALPKWQGSWTSFLLDGLAAVGVILVYYLPFLVLFWLLALDDVATAARHVPEIALFFFAVPCLIPVLLPLLPPIYWRMFPWVHLSPLDMILIGVVFWGTAFLMPAAFLQVSLSGKFTAAFRLDRVLRLVKDIPGAYCEAWACSLVATALALIVVPLAPWGIFWSYLVIVYAFNSALRGWQVPEVSARFRRIRLPRSDGSC